MKDTGFSRGELDGAFYWLVNNTDGRWLVNNAEMD